MLNGQLATQHLEARIKTSILWATRLGQGHMNQISGLILAHMQQVAVVDKSRLERLH